MKIFKINIVALAVFLLGSACVSGQVSVQNFMNKKSWSFLENKGQLADENGKKLTEIKYYGRQGSVNIYCKPNTISFVFFKIDNSQPVSEATGHSPSDRLARRQAMMKQYEDGTGKISYSRTDLVLEKSNSNAEIVASDQQEYFENYYTSATDENGIKSVHSFNSVQYKDIYPHIDLVLHTRESGIKYEFVIHPGGKVSDIQLQWNGAKNMALLNNGGIKYSNGLGEMFESKPISFLGNGIPVTSSFKKVNNRIYFKTSEYDKTQILTIDPTLNWGTYLGGSAVDNTQAMWLDNAGNVAVTGQTQSTSGIATSGAFSTSYSGSSGNNDAFVSKFSSSGGILWSTYYGYTGYDDGWSVSVDKYNNILMIGTTSSKSNITTSGSYQSLIGGTGSATYNAYVVKFSPNGSRFWATYFGNSGADQGLFMALDPNDNIFITCWITSSSGIATSGAYQTAFGGSQDASVEKFDSTGTKLLWSTYFGGTSSEAVNTIATDASGNVIICGSTPSSSGIASSGGYQTALGGGQDGFVASFTSSGGLNWATYFGGSGTDYGWGVATDASGNVIVCGQTSSSSGIASSGAYQTSLAGSANTYVASFSKKGGLNWSTYFGGGSLDVAYNITTDAANNIYITGNTTSTSGFASPAAFQSSYGGGGDAFLTKFLPGGTPYYSSYFGGSSNDFGWDIKAKVGKDLIVYITGGAQSSSGIATSGAYQTANGGSTDAFLAKFTFHTFLNDAGISQIEAPNASFCTGTKSVKVRLSNFGSQDLKTATIGWAINKSSQTAYSWKGTLKKDSSVSVTLGTFSFSPGFDTITSWTSSPNGFLDSFPQNDTVRIADSVSSYPKPSAGGNKGVCPGSGTNIGSSSISGHKYSWTSNPGGFSSTSANVVVSPTVTTTYYLTETNIIGGCVTKDSATVTVNPAPSANAGGGKSVCYGGNVSLGTTAVKNHTYAWSSVPTGFTSTVSNPTANPLTNTTYYVTEIDTLTGCFAYDNAYILVSAPGKANGGGNQTICSGGSFTLGAAAISGHSYSWISKPSGFTSTASNPSTSIKVKTVYYLTEKITSNGCTLVDSSVISVNPLPVPVTGGNRTVCALSNTVLGGTAVTGYTYSWVSNPSGFTSTLSNPTVNPSGNTTYYLTETNTATGCFATDSAVIKTNPAPPANAGGNHTICQGDNFQVGVSPASGFSYSWKSKPSGFTNTSSNPFVNPSVQTIYYVTETNDATGCSATDSAIISVNVISVSAGGNHTICKGNSIIIGQSAISGDSYSWSSSPAGFSSSNSNPAVSPTTTTTYYLQAGNIVSGCSKTDSAVIIVNPLPDAYTIANTSICLGSSISLGNAPVSNNVYSWISKPAGFTANASNPKVTPTNSAIYYLTETIQATGCTKTDSVVIVIKPLPVVHFTMDYFGKTTYLHASDSSLSDASYKWAFGDGDSAGGHLAKHLYQKNKPYTVSLRITGSNGCVKQLDSSVNVTISGINLVENNGFGLTVFPNPFGNITTATYNLDKNASVKITLVDITGRQIGLITDEKQGAGTYTVDIKTEKYNLVPGVYFVKFVIDGEVVTRQIVKR